MKNYIVWEKTKVEVTAGKRYPQSLGCYDYIAGGGKMLQVMRVLLV